MFMIQFLKAIYLTAFTILYRIPGGNPYVKNTQAVTVITVVEWFILLEIAGWFDMLIGERFLLLISSTKLAVLILFLALYFPNYRVLVTRGRGNTFEREFDNFSKSRRIFLVTSCAILLLASIASFMYLFHAYHRFFHIISKQ
jgi:hypothetical protein